MVIPRARRAMVLLSQSSSIYRNLALEDWLFRHRDFNDSDALLIWRNAPAVVIGRHQNVFAECDVDYLSKMNIDLVRRQSGGGTVLHSNGNYNFSFLTSNQRHNRLQNLELVAQTLKKKFNIDLTISPRHDLLLRGRKVSGTAAKLSSKSAYHHFTLLVSVDPSMIHKALQSSFKPLETVDSFSYESNATKSVKSKVGWLQQSTLYLSGRQLIDAVSEAFLSNYSLDMTSKEILSEAELSDPHYDGLSRVEEELRSWDWTFGKNPAFTLSGIDRKTRKIVKMIVSKGVVNSINDQDNNSLEHLYCELIGKPFDISFTKMFHRSDDSEPVRRFAG